MHKYNPWLKVRNLTKEYRDSNWTRKILRRTPGLQEDRIVRAVDNVSFDIQQGEIVGYLGSNGAGKSTTIKMIAGILTPTSGTIEIGGINPFIDTYKHKMELGVAFGQRSKLLWDLPVKESMYYHAALYNIKEQSKRVYEIAELFEIHDLLKKPTRQLSLGQRMRCELALTFLHMPKLILLDEPTIGLDFDSRDLIHKVIKRAVLEYNSTILLSSHDLKDVESVCSRIVLLRKGRVLFDGSIEELSDKSGAVSTVVIGFPSDHTLPEMTRRIEEIPGVVSVVAKPDEVTVMYRGERIFNRILTMISSSRPILSLERKEPSLEDLIRTSYQDAKQ